MLIDLSHTVEAGVVLPEAGFKYSAVPVKIKGFAAFPVRAFAEI